MPAALPYFVLAHNNRQFVFHDVPGDNGIVPPTSLLPRVTAPRVQVQSRRGGFAHPENRWGFATHSPPVRCWSSGMSLGFFKLKINIPAVGGCHSGAFLLGNQRDLAFPDRNVAGGEVTAARSKHCFISRTQKDLSCNFFFHLYLSSTFPVSVWEDMKEWFPTFLIITQGECNIQWELKWFIMWNAPKDTQHREWENCWNTIFWQCMKAQ